MVRRADTVMPVGQFAGIGLGISDEILQRLRRQRRIDCDGESEESHARNRVQVLDWIVQWPALEQGLVDMRNRAAQQKGVAIGAGARDRSGAQRTAGAAYVLDGNRAEQRFHLVRPWAGDKVVSTARRKRNDEPDWPRRIGLRPSEVRHGRKRGSTRGQMQQLTAGKIHGGPSLQY